VARRASSSLVPARRGPSRARLPSKLAALAVLACALAPVPTVEADTLDTDPNAGYVPIDELSYETIIRPGAGFEAELALRVALQNTSVGAQDAVMALAVPHGSELIGVAIAEGGDWIEGQVSTIERDGPDIARNRRDPGTVFVRELEPENPGDLPGAEIVAFSLAPGATTQIELRLRVHPSLRGDRWQLDLPRRNAELPNLSSHRRVLVQGLAAPENFWVDGTPSNGVPYMITRSEDAITVAWPAGRKTGAALDGSYEVSRDGDGAGGRLRLVLRLGPSKPITPDHVLFVVDRSQSTSRSLVQHGATMFAGLLDALPATATFDAITFAREAERLLDPARFAAGKAPRRDDEAARAELALALGVTVTGQGTDLRAAMELAGNQLAARNAKQPLIVVVTDGMLPPSIGADVVGEALAGALGKAARPEILFVVDDPLLNMRGLPADHPIADLAAGLGARISLETLATLGPTQIEGLLAAPRVLGGLQINFPNSVVLDEPLPTGLVAGDFVVIEGSYYGSKAPAKLTVRGRFGTSKISANFAAAKRAARPASIAAAIREGDRARAIQDGLALPEWYTPSMRRIARMNLAQAGRVGWQATGQLDSSIIERQLRTRVLPRARACYNKALSRNGVLAGRVELSMEVGKGEVMMARLGAVTLNHDDPRLLTCLESAAWAMDVPAGNLDTQIYVINYPLEFTAPEGGKPPHTGEAADPMLEHLVRSAEALADYQNNQK
jgi:hypothetical protein